MWTWENKWLYHSIIIIIVITLINNTNGKNEAQQDKFSNWSKVIKTINARSIN